ncbi:MAG: hypothetical protein KDK27_19820, partial [Leptospiraceae bacterium]|nr:hypothetical protein [Leptospiraceae bacterium]
MSITDSIDTRLKSRWRGFISALEIAYICLLPFLGALAAFQLESDFIGWIMIGGWLLAVLNVYIHAPVILSGYGRSAPLLLVPLVRIVLLAGKQSWMEGSIWNFFLDETILEAGSLMIAFALMFLFGRGISGNTAWQDLGVGMVVIMVGLFLGSIGGFLMFYIEQLPNGLHPALILQAIALGIAVYYRLRLITGIRDGFIQPDAIFNKHFFVLLGVIFT